MGKNADLRKELESLIGSLPTMVVMTMDEAITARLVLTMARERLITPGDPPTDLDIQLAGAIRAFDRFTPRKSSGAV